MKKQSFINQLGQKVNNAILFHNLQHKQTKHANEILNGLFILK
jgi:hypothetical protein